MAAARHRGLDVTYYNLGIRRDTSGDIAARWESEARRRLPEDCNPRLAFSFGTNDCATAETGQARVPLARAVENAANILSAARTLAPTLMVGPPPVLHDAKANTRLRELSNSLDELCRRLDIPFLETTSFVEQCDAWRREVAAGDGAHPNKASHAGLAAHIAAWPAYEAWLNCDAFAEPKPRVPGAAKHWKIPDDAFLKPLSKKDQSWLEGEHTDAFGISKPKRKPRR